ncbi:MAG: hypothetical protein RQ985_00830 [Dehalococcoidia bacterium]|jgi:ABC-type lipoprotein release transport system permease subunit|nr:hypothetical protein [Dehalococcoidia bacterium]
MRFLVGLVLGIALGVALAALLSPRPQELPPERQRPQGGEE